MKRSVLLVPALLVSTLAGTVSSVAQEKGTWRASSTTARGITGDIVFSNDKISINFSSFPLAQIRDLTPVEIAAAFHAESNTPGRGNLFRLSIPPAKYFLHHNTLCGSDETQWIATYVSGRNLEMAVFSGATMPVFTPEAIGNSTSLCGTFSYTR